MAERAYKYIIAGGGLAGGSAVEGIRELDKQGSVMLVGKESHLPYNRPPLSKKLWFGKKTVDEIFVNEKDFYAKNGVDVALETEVVAVDPANKTIADSRGNKYGYQKLLLATGGVPRQLEIVGGDLEGLFYYRYLDNYLALKAQAGEGKTALVVGGGFIGSEMAAALNLNKLDVTMIFPEPYLVQRVFPEGLGRAIQNDYLDRGVKALAGDVPQKIEEHGDRFLTWTRNGEDIESDILVIGVGIRPSVSLAESAGLEVGNGIIVNSNLQTSDPDIYAAGDNADFPYTVLGDRRRVEHWDNALNQGKQAGRNMAGAGEPYDYMPYFFSDLFDFGYEAVGDVDSKLDIFEDWQKEYDTGVIYYLKEGKVRGAMMCNVWDKVPAARELIKKGETMTPGDLVGVIQ